MAAPTRTQSPLAQVAGILSAAGGWAAASYCGASLLVPAVAVIALLLVFTKTPLRPRAFRGAISVIGGQIIWFVCAAVLLNSFAAVSIDVLLLLAGVIWLWLRPGLAPVLFLGIFELLCLAANVYMILPAAIGSGAHKALVVHILLRIAALIGLGIGYYRFRRDRKAASEPPALTPPPLPGALTTP